MSEFGVHPDEKAAREAAGRVADLFGPGHQGGGLMDIYLKPDRKSLRVNLGDWAEVGSNECRKAAAPVEIEMADEAGKPGEGHTRLWPKPGSIQASADAPSGDAAPPQSGVPAPEAVPAAPLALGAADQPRVPAGSPEGGEWAGAGYADSVLHAVGGTGGKRKIGTVTDGGTKYDVLARHDKAAGTLHVGYALKSGEQYPIELPEHATMQDAEWHLKRAVPGGKVKLTRGRGPKATEAAREAEPAAPAPGDVHAGIEAAVGDLTAGKLSPHVNLADLRGHPALAGHDRAAVDAALTGAALDGRVKLVGMDDPREITPRDRAAALTAPDGTPRHLLYRLGGHNALSADPLTPEAALSLSGEAWQDLGGTRIDGMDADARPVSLNVLGDGGVGRVQAMAHCRPGDRVSCGAPEGTRTWVCTHHAPHAHPNFVTPVLHQIDGPPVPGEGTGLSGEPGEPPEESEPEETPPPAEVRGVPAWALSLAGGDQPRVPAGNPDGGEFASGGGGGAAGKSKPGTNLPATRDKSPFAANPAEYRAAQKLARAKIAAVPVPTPEKVEKMRAALERAKVDPKARAGGDARGSSADRKARAKRLFSEFGGDEKGYVVCHGTGLKMHWSSDPAENPRGYPKFEQGKIFTARQGGGYTHPNLLPESFAYNRGRNDAVLRPENTK